MALAARVDQKPALDDHGAIGRRDRNEPFAAGQTPGRTSLRGGEDPHRSARGRVAQPVVEHRALDQKRGRRTERLDLNVTGPPQNQGLLFAAENRGIDCAAKPQANPGSGQSTAPGTPRAGRFLARCGRRAARRDRVRPGTWQSPTPQGRRRERKSRLRRPPSWRHCRHCVRTAAPRPTGRSAFAPLGENRSGRSSERLTYAPST